MTDSTPDAASSRDPKADPAQAPAPDPAPDRHRPPKATGGSSPPLWRSPWVWGFVVGALTLTFMRPFLRRVPPPPPGLAPLAELTWTSEGSGTEGWTALDADAIAVVLTEDATFTPAIERARKVALAWEATDTRRRAVVVLGHTASGCDTKALRRLAAETATPSVDWAWGCVDAAGWDVLDAAWTEAAPDEVGIGEAIALVDATGWLRALCDAREDAVVSEVWHRSDHVVASPVSGSLAAVPSAAGEMDENSP